MWCSVVQPNSAYKMYLGQKDKIDLGGDLSPLWGWLVKHLFGPRIGCIKTLWDWGCGWACRSRVERAEAGKHLCGRLPSGGLDRGASRFYPAPLGFLPLELLLKRLGSIHPILWPYSCCFDSSAACATSFCSFSDSSPMPSMIFDNRVMASALARRPANTSFIIISPISSTTWLENTMY